MTAQLIAPKIRIQRECTTCGATKKDEDETCEGCAGKMIRRSPFAGASNIAGPLPSSVATTLSSPGAPLDARTQKKFERGFGFDFSRVRVHADSRAADSASAIGANAYTAGEHIAFGLGRYDPRSSAGEELLAHELAHVVQQSGAPRASALEVGRTDDPLEKEADIAAERVLQGATDVAATRSTDPSIRRMTADPDCLKLADAEAERRKKAEEERLKAADKAQGAVGDGDPCQAQEVPAHDFEKHLALDQVTVVVLSSMACSNCEMLERSLEKRCSIEWGRQTFADEKRDLKAERQLKLRTLVVYIDPPDEKEELEEPPAPKAGEKDTNAEERKHVARWKASTTEQRRASRELKKKYSPSGATPSSLIYLDRELKEGGLIGANGIEQKASDVAASAVRTGGVGAGIGGAIGGAIGLGGGIGLGFGLEAAGMAVGGAAALGIVTALVLPAIGILIGWLLTTPHGVELSDERRKEVIAYLCMLDKHGPQNETALARDAVTFWGESGFRGDDPMFSVAIRRMLIRDLVEGATEDREERAIIKILERSSDESLAQILDTGLELNTPSEQPAPAVGLQEILDEIHGAEFEDAKAMLEKRYPAQAAKQTKEDVAKTTAGLAIEDPEVKKVMVAAFNASNMTAGISTQSLPEKKGPGSRECGAQFFTDPAGKRQAFENKTEHAPAALDPDQSTKVEISPIFCSPEAARPGASPLSVTLPTRDSPVIASFHTHPIGASETAIEAPSGRDYTGIGTKTISSETQDTGPHEAADPARAGNEHYVIGAYNIYLIQFDPTTKRRTLRTLGRTRDILGVGKPPPEDYPKSSFGV